MNIQYFDRVMNLNCLSVTDFADINHQGAIKIRKHADIYIEDLKCGSGLRIKTQYPLVENQKYVLSSSGCYLLDHGVNFHEKFIIDRNIYIRLTKRDKEEDLFNKLKGKKVNALPSILEGNGRKSPAINEIINEYVRLDLILKDAGIINDTDSDFSAYIPDGNRYSKVIKYLMHFANFLSKKISTNEFSIITKDLLDERDSLTRYLSTVIINKDYFSKTYRNLMKLGDPNSYNRSLAHNAFSDIYVIQLLLFILKEGCDELAIISEDRDLVLSWCNIHSLFANGKLQFLK